MNRESTIPNAGWIYGGCTVAALAIGYLLATPLDLKSIALVCTALGVLLFPLFMRWHHLMLVATWNASMILFFLPGGPSLGYVVAGGSLALSILHRAMSKKGEFVRCRPVELPLLFLALVVGVTILITGGIGSNALGSDIWGAKRYLGVMGAIMGYFALTAQPIPRERAVLYTSLFFLSGISAVVSDLAYAAGPSMYFLFAFFPSEIAYLQSATQGTLERYTGLAIMAQAMYWFMLLVFGIRGIFDWRRPWRALCFALLLVVGLFGGYRSFIAVFTLLFLFQFYYEGLFRTSLFPILTSVGVLVGVLVVVFASSLPLSVQRSISFLPLDLNPMAKLDAASTWDWRWQMWKVVVKDVPKYFFIGKGYSFSGTDLMLTQEAIKRGLFTSYEDTLVSGNYHSGPLTLIIPFGIFGTLAFLAFCWGSIRVLYANYRWGDPGLHRVNTFLMAYFVARLLFYLTLYGQFDIDLMVFTGTVAMSLALNGGVSRRQQKSEADVGAIVAGGTTDAAIEATDEPLLPDARRA